MKCPVIKVINDVFVDLGAEQPIAAEKDGEKIAVEIKSFRSQSDIRDFENAIGQYVFYRSALSRIEPDRKLYLAISEIAYRNTFIRAFARILILRWLKFSPSIEFPNFSSGDTDGCGQRPLIRPLLRRFRQTRLACAR